MSITTFIRRLYKKYWTDRINQRAEVRLIQMVAEENGYLQEKLVDLRKLTLEIEEERAKFELERSKIGLKQQEMRQLASAWHPFERPKKITKGHVKALGTISETLLEALEMMVQEFQVEMSNKAFLTDGEKHFKALHMSLGAQLLWESMRKRMKVSEEKVVKELNTPKEPQQKERTMEDYFKNAK